jgi:hypothetical protein
MWEIACLIVAIVKREGHKTIQQNRGSKHVQFVLPGLACGLLNDRDSLSKEYLDYSTTQSSYSISIE